MQGIYKQEANVEIRQKKKTVLHEREIKRFTNCSGIDND